MTAVARDTRPVRIGALLGANQTITDGQRAAIARGKTVIDPAFRVQVDKLPEAHQLEILKAYFATQQNYERLAKRWGCTASEAEERCRKRWERKAREKAEREAEQHRLANEAKNPTKPRSSW